MLFSLLFDQPILFILIIAALVISISIHEFAHALVADKLGDNTPRLMGRVTLNPKAHLDPVGSLLLVFAGFGWGRPVPFNPINLQNPKRDSALIALAGPASNILLASILALLFHLFNMNSNILLGGLFYLVIYYNIILGIFNMLPIHPLDGFKVVAGVLPHNLYFQWMQIESYGIYILLFMVITRTTSVVMAPLVSFLLHLFGL